MSVWSRIINGECLETMRGMGDCSVDAIVTDPPYGLAFMGAKWDSFNGPSGNQTTAERQAEGKRYAKENRGAPRYANSHGKKVTVEEMTNFQRSMTPIFAEALRVAKCGAHMLCFGGTRTFHRVACAIEDAGWEIRDTIMWVYGSGFPKSMDVGKAIDKALGAERTEVVGTRHRNVKPFDDKSGWNANNTTGDYEYRAPASDEAKKWDGWGTCLKPAWEPIIVARKPLDGTVAHNVITYGTGAINIDGCRVAHNEDLLSGRTEKSMRQSGGNTKAFDRPCKHNEEWQKENIDRMKMHLQKSNELGRFPANLVHDGSQEVLELFPDTGKSSGGGGNGKRAASGGVYGQYAPKDYPQNVGIGDSGSAARFFYCAKASKRDRGEGNDHPTVKPTALMRWLVRLVCPTGGTVLDPFMGSGSTGVAAAIEGMGFVGIDTEAHYCEIAEKRISDATGILGTVQTET